MEALAVAQEIGYRLAEAGVHGAMGEVRAHQDNWSEAAREFEQSIEIADDLGVPQVSMAAREGRALVDVYRNNLAAAREMVETARKHDVLLGNYRTSAILGVVTLLQGDRCAAREAFTAAANEASLLIALSADRYDALNFTGLSLCGLALCGDPEQIPAAKAAYQASRRVTSAPGVVRAVLQYFDALAQADTDGILAEVRPVAAGIPQTPQQ
jgi:hypothetical protein